MRGIVVITALVFSVLLGACTGPIPAPATLSLPPPTMTSSVKTGKIRIGLGQDNVSGLPFLMALDSLQSQGYIVETTHFDRFDLITAGLSEGNLDIVGASHQTSWTAIAKGAPIRVVITKSRNPYHLVARQGINSCSDLNGKTLAMGSTTGVVAALVNQYLANNCPTAKPQIVLIPNSANRMAALLAGQIDASPLELEELLQLEHQVPTRFPSLVAFSKEFPGVEISGYYAHRAFAEKNPRIIMDLVRAVVQARRQIQDKRVLGDKITKYYSIDIAAAQAASDLYLAQNMWDINGGLTTEGIEATIDFLTRANALPSGLSVQDVADLSYLNAVLSEIGRK